MTISPLPKHARVVVTDGLGELEFPAVYTSAPPDPSGFCSIPVLPQPPPRAPQTWSKPTEILLQGLLALI